MRRWLWALSVLAILAAACAGVTGSPARRPLSSTPAADGGPSEVEAATLTAIAVLVLATATAPPATATSRPAPTQPPPPTPTRGPTQPPAPPPTLPPAVVFLDDWTCTRTSIGQFRIEGKVRNTTPDRTLTFVRVRGTVRAAGVTNDNFSYIDSDSLRPGQTSTFSIFVRDPDPRGSGGDCAVAIENYRG